MNYNLNKVKKAKNKTPKIGRWILLAVALFFVWKIFLNPIKLNEKIIIQKGDTFQSFVKDIPNLKKLGLKVYLSFNKNSFNFSKIQEGTYVFEGKYTKLEFLNVIKEGPKQVFQKYTVLEGWSIYDIDVDLTKKGLISTGEYINFVNSNKIIPKYISKYDFLAKANKSKLLKSLEGFLYPDTYYVNEGGNVIDQLVYLQLDNFNNKVWTKYRDKIANFDKLSWYNVVNLASIIEKEEKNPKNRLTVAGIFLNRIDNGMRLGADITLCYGLRQPYETCTPAMISRKVGDKSNIYNTRQHIGMPPQAISNPSVDSIQAVLNYKKTSYFYYLHDMKGNIHYSKNLVGHNANKRKYLD